MPRQLLCHANGVGDPHTILRVFIKPGFPGRFPTRLTLDADERATLACLGHLILTVRPIPIYSSLHAAQWRGRDGGSIGGFPFYATISSEVNAVAWPTKLTTVRAGKNPVEFNYVVLFGMPVGGIVCQTAMDSSCSN